jgi:hypothetical protein
MAPGSGWRISIRLASKPIPAPFFRWQSTMVRSPIGTKSSVDKNFYSQFSKEQLKVLSETYSEALNIRQKLTEPYIKTAVEDFSYKKKVAHLTLFKKTLTDFLESEDAAALKCISKSP